MKQKQLLHQEKNFTKNIDWLFEFTQDFEHRTIWDKQTLEIGFLEGCSQLKKGAKVYTKSVEGVYMKTEYLTFQPPYEISIKMLNHSSVFKTFVGTWIYTEITQYETQLQISYDYTLRIPFQLFSKHIAKKVERNMKQKLEDLENYLLKIGL